MNGSVPVNHGPVVVDSSLLGHVETGWQHPLDRVREPVVHGEAELASSAGPDRTQPQAHQRHRHPQGKRPTQVSSIGKVRRRHSFKLKIQGGAGGEGTRGTHNT